MASAQTLHLVTPEAGLLAFTYNLVFLVLLGNTIVARPDRPRLLGSLLVILGAAFVVKYVILAAIYAADGGADAAGGAGAARWRVARRARLSAARSGDRLHCVRVGHARSSSA